MSYRNLPLILALGFCTLGISSCGKSTSTNTPVIDTPTGDAVDLSKVSMTVSNANIVKTAKNEYALNFDYTVINKVGADIRFLCLYNNTDDLIQVNLTDKKDQVITLGKRPLEGLTLTQPKPLRIRNGETTRSYTVPVILRSLKKGDPVSVRVRLHTPSRYDELRSSLEAPLLQILLP